MKNRMKKTWVLALLFLIHTGHAQTSEFLAKQAEGYFKNKQFLKALDILRRLNTENPGNKNTLFKRAICEYECNQLDSAFTIVDRFISIYGSTDESIYLKGKISMAKGDFDQAVVLFKKALSLLPYENKLKPKIIHDIKQCGVGIGFSNVPEQVFLEPAGSEVNTAWDETNPIYSINIDSKFYFNSNREYPGTLTNADPTYELPFDMYSTELNNGEWSEIKALNPALNTPGHDFLVDFSENGQVVYFKTGQNSNKLTFKSDTLNPYGIVNPGSLSSLQLLSHDNIYFFNDTFLLISSDRVGGFGGFDIYYAFKRNNQWTNLINCGNKINTSFDEIHPYLAYDGRTMIFSNNGINSMGGFDFFISQYNDKSMTWSAPSNLGRPINSAGDEKGFRLNKNRLSAIFSSNRKSGVGGYDIYFSYFRNVWVPQKERSRPVVFALVDTSKADLQEVENEKIIEKREFELENHTFYYESIDHIASNAFAKNLDKIKSVLHEHPELNTVIEAYTSEGNNQSIENHLQSVIIAENAKQYLTGLGIKPGRIWIKGYGSAYPIALENLNGKLNASGIKMNKRIEFSFFSTDPILNKKVKNAITHTDVSAVMANQRYTNFRSSEDSLNYKILVISGANASNLEKYIVENEFFIEKNNINGRYELMSKGYPDYEKAYIARKEYISKGFEDAVIIPYFFNQRLQSPYLSKWAEQFPDLTKYIYRSE